MGNACNELGVTFMAEGRFTRAGELWTSALENFQLAGDVANYAGVQCNMGRLHRVLAQAASGACSCA